MILIQAATGFGPVSSYRSFQFEACIMGWLLPKKFFRWTEPVSVNRLRMRTEFGPRLFVRMSLSTMWIFVAMIFPWCCVGDPSSATRSGGTLLFIAVLSVAIPLFFYAIDWLFSRRILVTEKGIHEIQGNTAMLTKYADICNAQFESIQIGMDRFPVLRFLDSKDRPHSVGIPPAISLEDLRCHLTERGVAIRD